MGVGSPAEPPFLGYVRLLNLGILQGAFNRRGIPDSDFVASLQRLQNRKSQSDRDLQGEN